MVETVMVEMRPMECIEASDVGKETSRDRFDLVLNSIQMVAVQGYKPDGTITFWNKASETLYGFTKAEIIGKDIVEWLRNPETRDEERRIMAEAIETGTLPQSGEVAVRRKDGSTCWVYANRILISQPDKEPEFFCFDIDITERKWAEEALRTSEAKFRREHEFSQLLLDTSPALIVAIGYDGKTIMMNRALLEMLEYTLDQALGTDYLTTFVPEDDRELLASVFKSIVEEGKAPVNENRIISKSGKIYLIEWHGATVVNRVGGPNLFVGVGIDITERKQAEADREKLEAQLLQAKKMEAIGQLAGGVAHDFNNMLQVILGNLDLVQDEFPPDTPEGEALAAVRNAAERATGLTRQLLAFSRRQIIQPVYLDLNPLIERMLKMVRRVIGEHIELRYMPGEHLGAILADRGQIEQILMNLCVNARDAMPTGGTLTIQTQNIVLDIKYCRDNPWASPGAYVLLSVTDTGCGMDEATLKQIFEPFFTTKEVGQGTGLGLATVYGTVQQHNGLVHVHSKPREGTRFDVYLPVVEQPAERVLPGVEPAITGGTETILVAEDDEAVRSLVERMLQSAGYTVLTAANGELALRVFEAHADRIDLAILDVMMPGLSGRDVMGRIQARNPQIRFLFSSGYSEAVIHSSFVIKEGLRLIDKPYSKIKLLSTVREILDERPAT